MPFELVDAVLAETGTVQKRVRDVPARVGVYLLLAGVMFPELGWPRVWGRLVSGLSGLTVARPSASSMAASRRRLGAAPLRRLFELVRGAAASGRSRGVWWHGRLVCALDGTVLAAADTPENLMVYRKGGTGRGATGYPLVRVVALVACGTRSVIDAVFGPTSSGEQAYVARLLSALHPGMILLADRNFGTQQLIGEISATGADLLVRVKNSRRLPVCRRLTDGSWISRLGPVEVRVVCCEITIATQVGRRTGVYQLVTTVLDPRIPATDLTRLYHDRWEVETAFLELKATILDGRVLRAKTPEGIAQEIYAVLVVYQALRTAIADTALTHPGSDPDRASFTIALTTAREQIIHAAGVLDEPGDLTGQIGKDVLAELMPDRRLRVSPRVVKRAISPFAANTGAGRFHGPSYKATLTMKILTDEQLTTATAA